MRFLRNRKVFCNANDRRNNVGDMSVSCKAHDSREFKVAPRISKFVLDSLISVKDFFVPLAEMSKVFYLEENT